MGVRGGGAESRGGWRGRRCAPPAHAPRGRIVTRVARAIHCGPGFNKTDMTAKYKDIWEIEGAVDVECGAMRVLHEINIGGMATTGKFINCEDGLQIPW